MVALNAKIAESKFAPDHNTANAIISKATAKTSALRGLIRPVTRGRVCVRFINLSMSRSIYMLIAFAPPAANEPPSRVIAISDQAGHLSAAKTIVGTVVINNNSMILGLVNAI